MAEIAEVIARLATTPLPVPREAQMVGGRESAESVSPQREAKVDHASAPDGQLVPFTCPECAGNLWAIGDGEHVGYECRVGHRYGEESLLEEQGKALEAALWSALEALEEAQEMARRLTERAAMGGRQKIAALFSQQAHRLAERSGVIRRVLASGALTLTSSGETV